MAIRVEIFDNFQVNGNTYIGSFPIFAANVVCSTEEKQDAASQIEKELKEIAEN